MTEEEKKIFHRLINKIIFNYNPVFEESEDKREEALNLVLEYVRPLDINKFKQELNKKLKINIYKKEFPEVGKLLLEWKNEGI